MQWQELRSHIRHLPARDITRIGQAFELGKKMHEGQKRRSGEPYFNHPVAVAHMLLALKADPDTIIAALLHDTVEDTDLTLAEIDRDFGGSVAALIDGVTKLSSKDVVMSPRLDEQIETLRKIFTLMQQDVRIMVIKLVDRLHNMQTVEFLPPERQKLLAKETIEVFVKIADKLCMQDMRDELESLCLAVLEPETHAALLDLRNNNEQRGTVFIEQLRTNLRAQDRILGSKVDLYFEHKTWDQMKAQLHVGGSVATGISFITVALICEDTDACYRVLGALHQLWKREVSSFQDFINAPQLNGYRGIHTTIIANDGTRVRCKIRTKEMHIYARSGITTKCFDSRAMGITDYLPWTKRLTSLTNDTAGSSDDFWGNLKSDILGDTIIIHGPDDSVVQLPRGSTALDGAFYLLQDKALFTESIKVNGVAVPFGSALSNAASIEIVLATRETYDREWLRFVNTGHAAAKIRSALATLPVATKISIGQRMLKQTLAGRNRGAIEEFNEKVLNERLLERGFPSLEESYELIGDGRLDPLELYKAMFEVTTKKNTEKGKVVYLLSFEAPLTERGALYYVLATWEASSILIHKSSDENSLTFKAIVRLREEDVVPFTNDLAAKKVVRLKIVKRLTLFLSRIAIPLLSLLWGLDCLLGKMLITGGVSPYDLTTLRFSTLFVMSVFYLTIRTFMRKPTTVPYKSLPLLNRYLLFSGAATFVTAISSYIALQSISTLTYGLCMNIGIAAVLLIEQYRSHRPSYPLILTSIALIASTLWLLLQETQSVATIGFIAGLGCGIGFAAYSYASRRYQIQESIHSRYPQFIFFYSSVALILCVPFFFLQNFTLLQSPLFFPSLLFVIFLTALPYIVYFELLKYDEVKVTWSYIPLFLIIMTVGEYVLYGNRQWILILPLALAVAWWKYYEPTEPDLVPANATLL